MSDLSDQRIKLIKEIADAKAKYQTIVQPWWAAQVEALDRGDTDVDLRNGPPEMAALAHLIFTLEEELVMIDPNNGAVDFTNEWREMLAERQQGRLQNEAFYRALGQRLSQQSTPRCGLSEDGRTYITPDAQVPLATKAAEVIGILVEQWKSGVENVSIAFVQDEIGRGGNIGSTRLRDSVGKVTYKKLITQGDKKGTIKLIHPPDSELKPPADSH